MLQPHIKNPFQYLTPEQIEANEALNLFVDVFKDYYQVLSPGNTFINGPRGSGKSMMFRIMRPDCQMIKFGKNLSQIDFYGVHIPIKDTSLNITELKILDNKHGGNFLNEHYLVVYFSIILFSSLSNENYTDYKDYFKPTLNYYNVFKTLLKKTGWQGEIPLNESLTSINDIFSALYNVCSELQTEFVVNYLSRLLCSDDNLPYNGPLCLYMNFLLPLIKELKKLNFLPKAPIYFLIDDADELNLTQTKILNSWVSYRTSNEVCFKITTQLKYLTFFTTRGSKIDTPHDYFEINLNQVYTTEQRERYLSNVRSIVEKRLKIISGINTTADDFFPENKEQKERIQKIYDELKKDELSRTKDKTKARDYAYRNARPNYMRELSNKYTYSYAGFDQLVNLSSGIIRNFLDLASKMFTSTINKFGYDVQYIPISIQNDEINKYSEGLLSSEFDRLFDDKILQKDIQELNKHKKLRNLIESVGRSFRVILLSNSSERRKFSFYFEGEVSDEIKAVLKLGVVYGYFHTSSLGSKDGLGRAKLFVLNRMLAPYYKLDPLSFSGYLYLTPMMLELAVSNPNSFIKKIDNKEYDLDKNAQDYQLQIDFE